MRVGRLVVVREDGRQGGALMYECVCQCPRGRTVRVRASHLRDVLGGRMTNMGCGCLTENNGSPTHKMTKTLEYKSWSHMLYRCHDQSCRHYHRYGGRGIRVCDRWRDSFLDFLADMGPRPTPKHSIDRIDNYGDYEPGNCRWATKKQQSRNRRHVRLFTYKGEAKCMPEWLEQFGLPRSPLWYQVVTKKRPFAVALEELLAKREAVARCS